MSGLSLATRGVLCEGGEIVEVRNIESMDITVDVDGEIGIEVTAESEISVSVEVEEV